MMITQIFINIGGGYFSGGNGTDHSGRAGHTVSSGKYAVDILNFTVAHGCDGTALHRDTGFFKMAGLNSLTDGHYHNITGNSKQGDIRLDRTGTSPGIYRTDDLRLHPQSRHIAVLVSFDPMRGVQAIEFRAFCDGSFHFLGKRRHIRLSSAVGDPHLFCTQTDSRAGTVHGHVTSADYDYGLVPEVRHVIIADTAKHLHCGHNSVCILAFDTDLFIRMGTDGNVDRIVFFM